MSFLIRLESVASPNSAEDEVWSLALIATGLGIGVIANVNGADAFAFPKENPTEVVRRWNIERRTGPTVASVKRKQKAARGF